MATEATWKPHEKHGRLTKQSDLPDTGIASPGAAPIRATSVKRAYGSDPVTRRAAGLG